MRRSAAAARAGNRRASGTDCRGAVSSARSSSARKICLRPRSSAGSAARIPWECSAPDRTPAPCASALPDRTVWNRWDRHWAAGRLPSAASARDPRTPAGCIRNRRRAFSRCLPRSARHLRCRPCAAPRYRRSGRNSSRSARRPCANRGRTPSAAGFRPDTICPARNAAGRPARTASATRRMRSSAEAALGRADRGDIPFRRFQIVDGDEGRLAAHGQAHVAGLQIGIDLLAEPVEARPGIRRRTAL